jgi:two-component system phosphate regulon sensor histidine kinase PhoR
MTDELESLFQKVNQQKNEFINLLSSIPDGICVMNSSGVILYTNEAFSEIFPPKKYNGLHFKAILNSIKFEKFIEKNKNPEEIKITEIDFNNKYYKVSLSYINSRDELILVFHDITESKRLEKVKKDFILNVSHELKTPLTAIKGFIETMEEDVVEPQLLRFIQIIRRNTDRLINIVQDLLLLSELEDEDMSNKLMITAVDLRMIIENIKLLFEQKLSEKDLFLNFEIDDNIPKVQVDSYRIEQVFINLINNSIKFTEKGGITISIKRSNNTKVQIEIADTGAGIPEEDQDRIFERFYISEKSRSKKYGGTGIGLSIVKHIIMLHQGSICIDKNYKNGTKFIITIPIEQNK